MNGGVTNYTYNGLGRITAANGSPYIYDDNGNLLSEGSEVVTCGWERYCEQEKKPRIAGAFLCCSGSWCER